MTTTNGPEDRGRDGGIPGAGAGGHENGHGHENRHGRRNPHGERRYGVEFAVYGTGEAGRAGGMAGMAGRPGPGGHALQARLYRNPRDGWVRGVCAGLGDYFGISAAWFRWATAFGLMFFTLPTLIVYFGAGWFLRERPEHLYGNPAEESFWRGVRTAPDRTFSGLAHRFRAMERRLRRIEATVTSREYRLRREIDGL